MTGMSPLRQQMTEELPWLFADLHFKALEDAYYPLQFGDCLVTLQSDVIRLQFARDRGQILIYAGPLSEPNRWWHIGHIL
jgi:hypothetical protein